MESWAISVACTLVIAVGFSICIEKSPVLLLSTILNVRFFVVYGIKLIAAIVLLPLEVSNSRRFQEGKDTFLALPLA